MRLAVVTTVAGRHGHLAAQHRSLAQGTNPPDLVVVVAMEDPRAAEVASSGPLGDRCVVAPTCLATVGDGPPELPLARARNLGVARAFGEGAELVVLLDVDCLAGAGLLEAYARAARPGPSGLLSGPVAYLPPPRSGARGYDEADLRAAGPHPARPAPAPGRVEPMTDLRLFWSLSFAVDRATWELVGGFDEAYVGYGGEDTDLAQRAAAVGVRGWWVGGARAWHQWHPVSDPPVEHVRSIVRNARLFHERWGWWPMTGWLEAFERQGLVHRTSGGWETVPALS